jgi:uncharacterized protein
MLYNLAQLLMEPVGSTRDYDVDDWLTGSDDSTDRAQGWIRVIRTHQGLLVRAKLETQVSLTCSRCVSDFVYQSVLTIEEESFPSVDPLTGRKTDPPEEAEGVIHLDDQHVLDMSEVMRQYLLTDTPIKPLCRKECPGLCPGCGTNLNEEKCKCQAVPNDPRGASLAELFNESQE